MIPIPEYAAASSKVKLLFSQIGTSFIDNTPITISFFMLSNFRYAVSCRKVSPVKAHRDAHVRRRFFKYYLAKRVLPSPAGAFRPHGNGIVTGRSRFQWSKWIPWGKKPSHPCLVNSCPSLCTLLPPKHAIFIPIPLPAKGTQIFHGGNGVHPLEGVFPIPAESIGAGGT